MLRGQVFHMFNPVSSNVLPGGTELVFKSRLARRECETGFRRQARQLGMRKLISKAALPTQGPTWGAECIFEFSFASSRSPPGSRNVFSTAAPPPPKHHHAGRRFRTQLGSAGSAERVFESHFGNCGAPLRGAARVFQCSFANATVPIKRCGTCFRRQLCHLHYFNRGRRRCFLKAALPSPRLCRKAQSMF